MAADGADPQQSPSGIRRQLARAASLRRSDKVYGFAHAVLRSMFRLGSAVLIARLASAEAFAVFVALSAIEVILTAVPNAWFLAPMGSIGPGLPANERLAFYAAVTRTHGRWSVVIGLAVFAVLSAVDAVPGLTANGTAYFTLYLIVAGIANGVRAREQSRFRSRRILFGDGLAAAATLVATWVRADFDERVLSTYFGTAALTTAFAVVWWNRLDSACHTRPVAAWARLHRMGPRIALGSAANSASSRVQPFVLAAVGGAVAVNGFGAAMRLVGPVRLIAMALAGVLRPRLALHGGRGDRIGAKRSLVLGTALVTGAGLVLFVPLWFAGEAIAVFVFGPNYALAGRVAPVATLYATVEAVGALLVVAVQTLHPDGAAVATSCRLGVGLIALLTVWPACSFAGPVGACWALVAAEILFVWWLDRALGASVRAAAAS